MFKICYLPVENVGMESSTRLDLTVLLTHRKILVVSVTWEKD